MNETEVHRLTILSDYLKDNAVSPDETDQLTALFSVEINNYCELVQGMDGNSCGMVIKGNGPWFSERNAAVLASGFSGEAVKHYNWLADFFEHKGGLSKFEWKKNEQDKMLFSHSCYFRRRPQVNEMLSRYSAIGITANVLNRLSELSGILNKKSIHFVAAAFNPAGGIVHKWYFSQFVDQSSYNLVLRRILYILELFKINPETIHLFLSNYARLVHFRKTTTLFISFSFSDAEIIPSVKIDLSEIEAADYLPLLDGAHSKQSKIFNNTLSYLGIRFSQHSKINLKYYINDYTQCLAG